MTLLEAGLDVLLIDGALRPASTGATYNTINPATEEVLGLAADATDDDVLAATAAARRSFDKTEWSRDLAFRLRCLEQLHDGLVAHSEGLRALTTAEVGAPAFLTRGPQFDIPVADIMTMHDVARDYEGWSEDLGEAAPMGVRTRRTVLREAAGVVGAITPWNFPHQINLAKLAPALAAGCTVVLKAAPDTPWAASALARIAAEETDLPAGVLNINTGSSPALGAAISADPSVDLVSFTGSTATGRAVMRSAADRIARVFLELGGKSAFVILDDADIAGAASMAAFTACTHAGQGCAITTRLLVPRAMHDEIVTIAAATMVALGANDPTLESTICGPLISARQRDRVEGYLRLATEEGGSFACGGTRSAHAKGFFIDPTLIVGLDNQARVAREEIFGPVLTVIPHDGDDDAIRLANDSPFGLSGSVFSGDSARAWNVARRVRTGTFSINGGVWYSGDVPFGGYKQSGIGREMGRAGFEEYLEMKSIAEGIQ